MYVYGEPESPHQKTGSMGKGVHLLNSKRSTISDEQLVDALLATANGDPVEMIVEGRMRVDSKGVTRPLVMTPPKNARAKWEPRLAAVLKDRASVVVDLLPRPLGTGSLQAVIGGLSKSLRPRLVIELLGKAGVQVGCRY